MVTDTARESATVATGILSREQFAQLSEADQVRVDADTRRLLQKHGQAWLDAERDRLRDEIAFAYGV